MKHIRILVALAVVALVTACGGDDNGGGNTPPATQQSFIQSVQSIINNASDTAEPQDIDGIALDTSDATEPDTI
ncbi:MAG: hypothetical protein H7X91_02535 [Burkholderiales bacterium]|nr:hypothetical protein [Burkholderiales bacterium]